MTSSDPKRPAPSTAARAQAAAWVARLHGPNRTEDVEAGLRRWLADDPDHAAAFELLTDTWEKSAQIKRRPLEHVASWERVGFRMSFSRVAVAAAFTSMIAVVATLMYLRTDAVATGIGEYRTLALEDGTRVHLNTNTRVRVRFDKELRRVVLDKGEALFEVAKRPDWPFVVSAAGRKIRALGTVFVVRNDDQKLAVTLVEGKVTVSESETLAQVSDGEASASNLEPKVESRSQRQKKLVTLAPGQRLTVATAAAPTIDWPSIERVTAWEHGQVSFDDTPLTDAIAEMNRYSRVQITMAQDTSADIRVSGIFEAGDSEYFAQAVSRTYQLKLFTEGSDHLVLSSKSQAPDAIGSVR